MDDSNGLESVEWIILLLVYGLPLLALIIFGLIGATVEKRHYASIRAREAATASLPAVTLRKIISDRVVIDTRLVAAEVAISHDHFKRFLANLRKIFGGRLRSYETLVDRARREALLRLKEQCPDASLIANVRFETSMSSSARGNRGLIAVELIAYGTAIRFAPEAAPAA